MRRDQPERARAREFLAELPDGGLRRPPDRPVRSFPFLLPDRRRDLRLRASQVPRRQRTLACLPRGPARHRRGDGSPGRCEAPARAARHRAAAPFRGDPRHRRRRLRVHGEDVRPVVRRRVEEGKRLHDRFIDPRHTVLGAVNALLPAGDEPRGVDRLHVIDGRARLRPDDNQAGAGRPHPGRGR